MPGIDLSLFLSTAITGLTGALGIQDGVHAYRSDSAASPNSASTTADAIAVGTAASGMAMQTLAAVAPAVPGMEALVNTLNAAVPAAFRSMSSGQWWLILAFYGVSEEIIFPLSFMS